MELRTKSYKNQLKRAIQKLDEAKKIFFNNQQELRVVSRLLPIERIYEDEFSNASCIFNGYGYYPTAKLRKVIRFQRTTENSDLNSIYSNLVQS